MRNLRIYQVDAFTREKFVGNPAGVILGAEVLSDTEMQAIARELNNPESAFVLPGDAKHDVEVRFFTPSTEVPMCGHATVATHFLRAELGLTLPGRYAQKTKAGSIPFDVDRTASSFAITMHQNEISFLPELALSPRQELLRAIGLVETDLETGLPLQPVSTANGKIMIPLVSRAKLDSIVPDLAAVSRLTRALGATGIYPFVMEGGETHGRMFGPAIGISEDPTTGMAIAPLAGYLFRYGKIQARNGVAEFTANQGKAMGRPGLATARVFASGDKIENITVTGEAVVAFSGEITL